MVLLLEYLSIDSGTLPRCDTHWLARINTAWLNPNFSLNAPTLHSGLGLHDVEILFPAELLAVNTFLSWD